MGDPTRPPAWSPNFVNIALKGALVVEIGPKRKKFSIHKALLAEHSAFFRGAMRGPWKEAQEGVVTLDDIEPDTFKIVVNWLYTKNATVHRNTTNEGPTDTNGPTNAAFAQWLKLYIFADRFLMPDLRRLANTTVCHYFNTRSVRQNVDLLKAIPLIWDKVPANRVILETLVEAYRIDWDDKNSDYIVSAMDQLPTGFFRRVMLSWRGLSTNDYPKMMKPRCYLEHVPDIEQVNCKKLHMQYDEARDLVFFE